MRRIEIATQGIDDALQGMSSDPMASTGRSVGMGLRIPAVLNNTIVPGNLPTNQPRYLFLLASVRFQNGIRLIGIRQGLTIGINAGTATAPRIIEAWVDTPSFKFPDGNVSWHVVVEQPQRKTQTKKTDTQNWAFLESDQPAMLYNTFTNSFTGPDGAPIWYMQALTAYTPPQIANSWISVGGLGNMHDIRWPWFNDVPWGSIDHVIRETGGGRLSFYASVLQTNPNTRVATVKAGSTLSAFAAPEEQFIQDFTTIGVGVPTTGPVYWRIGGALIVEVEDGWQQ